MIFFLDKSVIYFLKRKVCIKLRRSIMSCIKFEIYVLPACIENNKLRVITFQLILFICSTSSFLKYYSLVLFKETANQIFFFFWPANQILLNYNNATHTFLNLIFYLHLFKNGKIIFNFIVILKFNIISSCTLIN